ncbi:MAG: helix-hairpin-helix domain-containing protein [Chryseolinea sp.]
MIRLLSVLLSLLPRLVYAQELPLKEIDMTRLADELFGVPDEDLNYDELYDNLMQMLSNPINLNKADTEDLVPLHVMTNVQIKALLDYRNQNGDFLSLYELQAVPGFDPPLIEKLAPFIKIIDPETTINAKLLTRIKSESDNFFLIRTERTVDATPENMAPPSYEGSPDKIYVRFRSSRAGDYSFGFCGEKDQGEAFRWDGKRKYYMFDYWSFHGQLQNKGRIKNLIVGDFQAQFGQGVMIGGAFGTGKGSETITAVRRSNIGVLPYTSVYESGGFRGAAATVTLTKSATLTAYYSACRRDASVPPDSIDSSISAVQQTGFHRNEKELDARKQLKERSYGAVFQYKRKAFEAGIMYHHFGIGTPIIPKQTPYNQFAFTGSQFDNVGIFLNYEWNNFSFFNETAHTLRAGVGSVTGVLCSLTPYLDVSLLYRCYARNFYTQFANPFSEVSEPQNESGLYWGWKYRFSRKFTVAGYFDMFRFPWLRYRSYAPSAGYESLIRVTWQPSRKVMLFLQCREESKDRNVSDANVVSYRTSTGVKRNYWLHCELGLHEKIRLKSRAQFSSYLINGKHSTGFIIAQDISVNLGRFQVGGRYALFETDDYDNRQYAYENDVLLAYSMPALYGTGVRKVFMVRYKLSRSISIWMRYATTRQINNPDKAGNATEGSLKKDLKFQVKIQF